MELLGRPGTPTGAGDGLGVGLMFRLAKDGTLSLGWEAGAMATQPVLKVSAGGSYALNADPEQPALIHYIAFEPWLLRAAMTGPRFGGQKPVCC